MSKLREIKRRIKSVNNIAQVTYAMQLVAASRMRKAEQTTKQGREYMLKLREMLAKVASSAGPSPHPLLEQRVDGVDTLFILYSPQRGLAGSLPANLLRFASNLIFETERKNGKAYLVTLGRKLRDQLVRRGYRIDADFSDIPENLTTADVRPIIRLIEEMFMHRQVDRVIMIYPDFENALTQHPIAEQLLPISDNDLVTAHQSSSVFTFEPTVGEVLGELVPLYLETMVYQARLETVASEYSARMIAMQNATDNASEIKKSLALEYNKSRQAHITTELAEITAGMIGV
ncbi:ATP synthase F1 subunit gamma [candidate division WWE3 bacterium]|nr:ATP synthase F1 subunit gamma [candidate division WWE3 bacterium]